ncbi:SURF1 family protein [Polaromonas sp. SM01]|uniref:SURF1 family protein n=1 Tax=Polaromonas sp. SM01 TaxID=3085630 RepID=UPI0029810EDA|nr:SURF1 family protein [Polaromonas sp. SM01]MDW5445036.1 SURF1 family protein [Polaromonas sp. SM01]
MASRAPRSTAACLALAACAILLFTGFLALGIWQIERRAWKLDLMERVAERVHAPATPLPPMAEWPQITAASDEYRHVQVSGRFLHDRETLVQAVTTQGAGFWVLTPLQVTDGSTLLINRGFVPPEARSRATRHATESDAEVTVVGLLRLSEPVGGFLRHNDPVGDRWYSRDVVAIAQARGLNQVAPFFLDADAQPRSSASAAPTWPLGGLTVITFKNHHLMYALTWFGLVLMVIGGSAVVIREERQRRRERLEDNTRHVDRETDHATPD